MNNEQTKELEKIVEKCPHSRKVTYFADGLYHCEKKEDCKDKLLFGYTTNYCRRYLK
jgi:hypothetical protein